MQVIMTVSDGSAVPDSAAALRRALDGEWRGWAAELGAPTVSLAEVVTSLPGGAPQTWHFDGHGVTLQLALSCLANLACVLDRAEMGVRIRTPIAAKNCRHRTRFAARAHAQRVRVNDTKRQRGGERG